MILLLLTTTAVVLLPEQVVPTETTTHAPSKLPPPPPPPLRREVDRRGSSASGLLRRAGRSGSTDREPDSDFSSLPMLPPALPDCAGTGPRPINTANETQTRPILIRRRKGVRIITSLPITRV